MSTGGSTFLHLAARRRLGDVIVGVVRAAMDEQLGIPVAELHVARPRHSSERVEVREGQNLVLGGADWRVSRIRPFSGYGLAGVELTRAGAAALRSEALGESRPV